MAFREIKAMEMPYVKIYTDGAARGNPEGPGGYGTILQYVDKTGATHEKELSGGVEKTSNNRMELTAAITGLEALSRPCRVELWSDSQYLVRAFSDHWIDGWIRKNWKTSSGEPVKNRDLWERLLTACSQHQVTFHWVRGHNGHPENERCDKLATAAADQFRQRNAADARNPDGKPDAQKQLTKH